MATVMIIDHFPTLVTMVYCTPGRCGSIVSSEAKTVLFTATSTSSSTELPGQLRDIITSKCPKVCSGVSSWADMSEIPLQGGVREASFLLKSFNWLLSMHRRHASTLCTSYSSEHFTPSLRLSPATLQRKLIPAACIHSLELSVTTQKLMTIGKGRNTDWLTSKQRVSPNGSGSVCSRQTIYTCSQIYRGCYFHYMYH